MAPSTSFVKNVATRLSMSKHVEELRFLVSPQSSGSKGLREFIESAYVDMKKLNPLCPMLVREHGEVQATIVARFDKGRESTARVENLGPEQVAQELEKLIDGRV